jgi:hypothetical protein
MTEQSTDEKEDLSFFCAFSFVQPVSVNQAYAAPPLLRRWDWSKVEVQP